MSLTVGLRLECRMLAACAAVLAAIVAARCGGSPVAPPPPPPPNTPPVVRSVAASRMQVESGQEVELTATVEDAETPPDLLQYNWTADPAGGTFTGTGRIVRWRAPTDGPVPQDYTIRLSVVDGALIATGASAPIRVNDAIREMRQLGLTFIADFTDTSKSPEFCVRNFTDSCPGKGEELNDIRQNRIDFDQIVNVSTPVIREIQLNSGTLYCSYPPSLGGRQVCALLIAGVDWRSRWSANNTEGQPPGTWEHVVGDAILTGVYERQQWWLCDSRFEGSPLSSVRRPFLR